jgi:N-acetylmuramoyl-L-alanine amidase
MPYSYPLPVQEQEQSGYSVDSAAVSESDPAQLSAVRPGHSTEHKTETACLKALLPQNMSMSTPTVVLALVLAFAAGGCASGPRRSLTAVPDWQEAGSPAVASIPRMVPPPPSTPLAPPATNFLTTAPTSSAKSNETWVPLRRWSTGTGRAVLTLASAGPAPTYRLRSVNGALLLRIGSQSARWDGLELRLGFAPQLIDGQPFVHSLDLKKTIQPLLDAPPSRAFDHSPVIIIDPGHGGEDSGARNVVTRHYEKEYTLDWALRIRSALATSGFEVFLTRTTDSEVALSNRVAFASSHKANLFLSLHFNSAAPNETEAGIETYCLTPAGMPSSLTRGYADELTPAFPNNAFDHENLQLALNVHRAVLHVNGNHDRGVRRARFPFVLRGQQCPAVLLEGGYLSNPYEARLIADPAYRQRLAEAVARAVESWLKRESH